ncbi:nucleotidyltransferase family protein [Nonomuraea sp. KM88]|uniref:nucleotidyltransferase family protein n=1 Tax=Nonomuraea sp. KM88 TaxID=3457427 RepID=UPI003FCE8E47
MRKHSMHAARAAVRSAGVYGDSIVEDEALARLGAVPVALLADALIDEKVSSLVLERLKGGGAELAGGLHGQARFAEARARIEAVARHKDDVLPMVDRQARELGISVWAIKGLAAEGAYPERAVRDLGDLDLMVATVDDAVRLTARLREAGYDFDNLEWPWVKRSLESGVIYGQFNLNDGALENRPTIDLHFGGYSVRHCGFHPLGTGERKPGLSYYEIQQNMPLLVANAAGDHDITTKDLNDFGLALQDPSMDWDQLLRELEAIKLLGFFKRLAEELDATPLRPLYRDSVLPTRLKRVRAETPAPRVSLMWQRRWAATVRHAYALGARHSYARATVTTLSAARYYWGHRVVKVRSRAIRPGPRLPRLVNWTCVRLIPAALVKRLRSGDDGTAAGASFLPVRGPQRSLSEELTAIRSPVGDIIRTRLGDFVPAVYHVDDPWQRLNEGTK